MSGNGRRWVPSGGHVLEPNALSAATEQRRNTLVIAGPGAGKTELLAQRADFLLRTGGCRYPRRILAISFKTDAAQNLRARVVERCGADLSQRLDSHTFHAFAKRLIDKFRVVLTGDDALDQGYTVGAERVDRSQIGFDDMVPLAIEILRTSGVARNAVRSTYSHVFLDEFQDCTSVQYTFVCVAFGSTPIRVTAVGDSKQRIMRFAGALDGVFSTFAEDHDAELRYLYQNHRSSMRVRRVHNAMVKVMDPPAAVADGELAGDDGFVELYEYESCTQEADDLATRIQSWIDDDGVAPSEIAVLVRQQAEQFAQPLMDALDTRGIAFRNEQTVQEDFAQPVGQLILDFLAVTLHVRQPEAHRRLMDVLTPTSGDDEADDRNAARWNQRLHEARAKLQASPLEPDAVDQLDEVVRQFLADVGTERLTALSPEYATAGRLQEVVESVLSTVHDLAGSVDGLLVNLTHVTDDGAVRILTIHKSKGLEFDTVVVLGVEKETYWGDLDDARAAFFVAISRAKRRLVVTTSQRRARPSAVKRWDVARTRHAEFIGYVQRVLDE